jgi:23S rRNA pseudouridine2605 synthase
MQGVRDQDEELLIADDVEVLKASGRESLIKITLSEGKNREIRRLCASLGHEVTRLKRISFGKYELGDLKVGQVRECLS